MGFVDDIREVEMKDLYRFWLSKRAGRSVPLRSDISPRDIKPESIPHLFMYRKEADGRLRCILIGTEMVNMYRRDETGRYLDELLPAQSRDSRLRLFQRCLDDARPIYYAGPTLIKAGERRDVGRLLLPLSSDGRAADHIFGMALFGPAMDSLPPGKPPPENDEPAFIAIAGPDDL